MAKNSLKPAKLNGEGSSATSFGYKKRGGGWPISHFIFSLPYSS